MRRMAVLLLLAIAGCGRPSARALAASLIVDRSRPSKPLGQLPAADAAAAVDAVYRLLPDRRFLLAVRDIYALQRGGSASVEVDFEKNGWRIRCGGLDAGRLPLIPSFGDGMAMLTAWSTSLGPLPKTSLDAKTRDACDRRLRALDAPSLFEAAKQLRTPAGDSVERAARAAVALELQSVDVFELGDPLAARALALVAMAGVSNASSGKEDAALLANAFRYETEARRLADALPAGSAARIATGLDAPQPASANPLIAYVSAQRVIATMPHNQRLISTPDLGVRDVRTLPLLLASDDLIEAGEVGRAVQSLLVAEVTKRAPATRAHFGGAPGWIKSVIATLGGDERHAAGYESAIGHYCEGASSPLLGTAAVRAYYDAIYYTSLERQLRVHTMHFSSEPLARSFLDELEKTDSQPGRDVRRTLAMLVATTFGDGRGASSKDLVDTNNVGAGFRAGLFITLSQMHGFSAEDRDAEPAVLSLLDTRPAQRLKAGVIAMSVTGDPMRRDLYVASVLEAAPRVIEIGSLGYFAHVAGDLPLLRELTARPDIAPTDRAVAARYLAEAGENEAADRAFERLFRETDYNEFYSTWAAVINERGDWSAKERAARRRLEQHPEVNIEDAYYAASLADALERQGRYREAWQVVEPYVDVWSANIIGKAVSLHQRLGRVSDSDELGKALVERYPDAWNRVTYAAVLWRQKRWTEAAALFNPKRASIPISDWREHVPVQLAQSFSEPADVAAAVGALTDAGVSNDWLGMIPDAFTKHRRPDLAFAAAEAVCQRYPLKNEPVSAQTYVDAYRALAAWKGREAAIAWLRQPVNEQNALQFATLLFQDHDDDAVLALADFAPRVRTDEMHAYLAQAMTRLRLPQDDPRVVALRTAVAGKPWKPRSLEPLTLYLLGLMSEKDFLSWPYEPSGQTASAYIVGLKTAAAGDYDRALPYFIAARHGVFGTPPQMWAVETLNLWSRQGLRWQEIVRKRIL